MSVEMLAAVDTSLDTHRRYLWGLAYRVTGCAADADEIVQDCFVRALERPPADTTMPWRPWLRAVALNLARDALRRRRRQPYDGTWLPTPILTADWHDEAPDGKYQSKESLTMAFLVALEQLTFAQRAVLVLRDVYDLSARETADALGMSDANVRVSLHRARKALEAYDETRVTATPERLAALRAAVATFMMALGRGDLESMKAALEPDVTAVSDANGEFLANRKVVRGPEKVALFFLKTRPDEMSALPRLMEVSGWPALMFDVPETLGRGRAQRGIIMPSLGASGRIGAVRSVLATAKLAHVFGS